MDAKKDDDCTVGQAPRYHECPDCGFLSEDPGFATGVPECPSCGRSSDARRCYPSERLRRLDARVRRYHEEGEDEIVVILVAAFLEAILEDLIDRLLIAHGADLPVRRLLLDGERGIGGRLAHVFPKLTGGSFEGTAKELDYEDFPLRWREMRKARNAFIHDSPFNGPRETLDTGMADTAMELLDRAYRLFVLMNNRFVAELQAAAIRED